MSGVHALNRAGRNGIASPTRLSGREEEVRTLERLLESVGAGGSQALVVRGAPGIGKTALLGEAIRLAPEFRVARAGGVEAEMELAFAALQQLCAPMLDRLERVPAPQRDALGVAFGLHAGDPPDRFLVGLAVLSLLSEVAEDQPLLCVIDDAQWLDQASAQALAFVARRLLAESVALLFATREESAALAGVPELVVEGLSDDDARALLGSVLAGPMDEGVRDRFVAETHGNPLALLELPRGLTPGELAGGFGRPGVLPGRIEESFRRRFERLPAETRRLMLVAAAEPVGEPALVWRAAKRLGIPVDAAVDRAITFDGLLTVGARVVFRHPLVRSAVYRAAAPEDCRAVHQALADATDPEVDPDRRAWHRAYATAAPEETVAAELENSAGRARGRGGVAAAAALLARAAELTPDPARRGARALAAAQAKHEAGAPEAAMALLAAAEAGPLDELQRACIELLRAQIAVVWTRGLEAAQLLLKAAKRLEPLDATLARETHLEALSATVFTGRLAGPARLREVAQAARAAPPPPSPPAPSDLLLEGLAVLLTEGDVAAAPLLRRVLSRFRDGDVSGEDELRWLWLTCRVAMKLWDDESWYVLSTRAVQRARDVGTLTLLPHALTLNSGVYIFAGEFAAAEALGHELDEVTAAIGAPDVPYTRVILAGWRGDEAEAPDVIETTARGEAVARGEGRAFGAADYAAAVLYNGLGRYADALAAAQRSSAHPEELVFSTWGLFELIEAATHGGRPELGAAAFGQLSDTTRAAGTNWALGVEAYAQALLSEADGAEDLYREAIERIGRTRARAWLARAHLVYGEWLRREKRRLEARDQLRNAQDMFVAMGADAFAERARRELLATGERTRKRTVETLDELTPQEAQIARLARDGLSNPEIAAQLFISPRTVQYHLHKVFGKLRITSRVQLEAALSNDRDA